MTCLYFCGNLPPESGIMLATIRLSENASEAILAEDPLASYKDAAAKAYNIDIGEDIENLTVKCELRNIPPSAVAPAPVVQNIISEELHEGRVMYLKELVVSFLLYYFVFFKLCRLKRLNILLNT